MARRGPASSRTPALLLGACLVALIQLAASDARACSWTASGPSRAWPVNGAQGVSPATSIFVLGSTTSNGDITLTANGSPVPLSFAELGRFYPSQGSLFRAKLPDLLEPSTEYVLEGPPSYGNPPYGDAGASVELTRFTTAATYDKVAGTPPSLSSLKLWSVRYPLDDIGSGSCVFAEYQGYAQLDFQPAQIPSTTASGTLYTLTITPRTGGAPQSLHFAGDAPFEGHELSAKDPYPNSLPSEWFLDLDPRREYCATLSARGDGDNARLPVVSEPVCTGVVELCAKGAECAGAALAPDDGGGCSTTPSVPIAGFPALLLLAGTLGLLRSTTFARVGAGSRRSARQRTGTRQK
jgi:hypothetical protein